MPLLDLSRIILHRTVIGITCPSCSGNLQAVIPEGKGFWRRLLPVRFRKTFRYRCEDCGQRFRMHRS